MNGTEEIGCCGAIARPAVNIRKPARAANRDIWTALGI